MGATTTILLPAGRPVSTPATHDGVSNGLEAQCLGNDACQAFAKARPGAFLFAANEVPDVKGAVAEIDRYLRLGAVMVAEQKFGVECDSPEMHKIYRLADARKVPVLMHWQFEKYNYGFERFHKILAQLPEGQLHRARADVVGQHRQESHRSIGAVPERAGDAGRVDRPIPERLSQHVR